MATSRQQTLQFTEDNATSSRGATPANPIASQAKGKGLAMKGIYGLKCIEHLSNPERPFWLTKMLLAQFPTGFLTGKQATWRVLATPMKRLYCQLMVSGQTIKETEYLSLPTPNARDYKDITPNGKTYASTRGRHSPSVVTEMYLKGVTSSKDIANIYEAVMGYPEDWTNIE